MAKKYNKKKQVTLRNKILDKIKNVGKNEDSNQELDLRIPKRFEGDEDDDGDCDMY